MAQKDKRRVKLEGPDEARPVKGRVIKGNIYKPLSYVWAGAGLIAVALGVLAYIGPDDRPKAQLIKVRPYVAIGYGILIILVSTLTVLVLMIRGRRMILGEDRLQLVGRFGRVIGQVPFDNIISTRLSPYGGVELILDRIIRKDTWWPRLGKKKDCGLEIPAGLESDATAVRLYLRDALREYWEERGGSPWPEM